MAGRGKAMKTSAARASRAQNAPTPPWGSRPRRSSVARRIRGRRQEIVVDDQGGVVAERAVSKFSQGADRPQLPCAAREDEMMIEEGDGVASLLRLPDVGD